MPDRYWHDVEWWIVKKLKQKLNISFVKDNSIERGPLKAISSSRFKDDVFKYNYTTSHQKNVRSCLKNQKLPCLTDEYPHDSLRHLGGQPSHPRAAESLLNNGWIHMKDTPEYDPQYILKDMQGDDTDYSYVPIEYYINKQGFRHDGSCPDYYSEQGGAIYIGDSHTMAVGLPIEKSWTYLAHYKCGHTKDLRYLNMGMPGYGIDAYYRLLKRHIEDIKPNYVMMSYPWQTTRAEVWSSKHDRWHNETINKMGKARLEDETSRVVEYFHTAAAYMRWYKNLDAIKWLCHENGAQLYAVEEETSNQRIIDLTNDYRTQLHKDDWARDLVHAGVETHEHNSNILAEIMEIRYE